MNNSNHLFQDVEWGINDEKFIVRNVPVEEMKNEEKFYFSMDVVLKLTMIRDLICNKEIQIKVDFNDVKDILI